jgi:hypothetical protein
MTTSDTIAIWNIVATVIAVVAAPVIALWIGGILQTRANTRRQQIELLSILLSLRHRPLLPENFTAMNSIDAVFADSAKVRDAWTKYYTALNDPNLNVPTGYAIREEKRRDLLTAIVSYLGLEKKITTTDLLRTYTPSAVIEMDHLEIWERIKLREDLRAEFIDKGIGFPDFQPVKYPVQPRAGGGHGRNADQGANDEKRNAPVI